MENIKLLRLYRKSLAKDNIAVRILAYIMLSNSLTENELKRKLPEFDSKSLRNKLIELYRANFIRSIDEDLWTTTNLSEFVLSELGIPDSLIILLARELGQSEEDIEFLSHVISTYYRNAKHEKDSVLSKLRALLLVKPHIEKKIGNNEDVNKLVRVIIYSSVLSNSELLGDNLGANEVEIIVNKYFARKNKIRDLKKVKFLILNACENAIETSKDSNKNILEGNLSGDFKSNYYTIIRYYSTFFTGRLDNYFYKSISLNQDRDDYIQKMTKGVVSFEEKIASNFSSSLSSVVKKWLARDIIDFTLSTIPLLSLAFKIVFLFSKKERDITDESLVESSWAKQLNTQSIKEEVDKDN